MMMPVAKYFYRYVHAGKRWGDSAEAQEVKVIMTKA